MKTLRERLRTLRALALPFRQGFIAGIRNSISWIRGRTVVQWTIAGLTLLAVSVIAVASVPNVRQRAEWGTVPAWMTVAGGAFAALGAAVSYQSLQLNLKHRRDDEKAQARLLLFKTTASYEESADGPVPTLVVTSRNAATEPLHHVRVVGVTCNGTACTQDFRERMKATRDRPASLSHNERQDSMWIMPEGTNPLGDNEIVVGHTYIDSEGRRWQRLNSYDPERIYSTTASKRQDEAFTRALRERRDKF